MKPVVVLLVAFAFCLVVGSAAQAQGAYVTYYAAAEDCCSMPVAVTTYYAPAPVVAYQPAAVVRTRWRPLLGGFVSRVRYRGYAPVVYSPACCW